MTEMKSSSEIQEWRRSQRTMLLERRMALGRDDRTRLDASIIELLERQVPELHGASVGFYWPFRAEIDLRTLAKTLHGAGARLSLPVVVEKAEPLEFWHWEPGTKLVHGVWRIPVPEQRVPARPTHLLVPLLGFDEAGFRLGYGGGYYDRTLAALDPRPRTIGVGYELGRLESIYPQPHDIPMDAVVTEAGVVRFDTSRRAVDVTAATAAAIAASGGSSKASGINDETRDPRQVADDKLDQALKNTFPASDPFSFL